MHVIGWAMILAALSSACAGNGDAFLDSFTRTGPGAIEGVFGGSPMDVTVTLSHLHTFPDSWTTSIVFLSDYAGDLCETFDAGLKPTNARIVVLQAYDYDVDFGSTAPTEPGTYPVFPAGNFEPRQAHVAYYRLSGCQFVQSVIANEGTVTYEEVEPNVYEGRSGFTLENGDSADATFHPEPCPSLINLFDGTLDCP